MKGPSVLSVVGASFIVGSNASESNPLGKVLELMDGLTAKVTAEGEAEAKAFKEYFEWCDEVNTNTQFEIKAAKASKEKLEAKIAKLASDIEGAGTKIEELAKDISSATAELDEATAIRKKEHGEFVAAEKELVEGVDTLGRAIGILEKEMQKNPAMLAQVQSSEGFQGMLQSIQAVVDAASFSTRDRDHLLALVQSQHTAVDEDLSLGAPAAANYKSQSGGIVEVLGDMKEKAEGELSELRKVETKSKGEFALLKGSLDAQLAQDNKDMDATKSGKAEAEEAKAESESDLSVVTKDLAGAEGDLDTARTNCMQVAADHGATVKARAEELKVIAKARQIIAESSSGAVEQTYSFLQVESRDVASMVKKLARQHRSAALAQLASRISSVQKYGAAAGEDVFGKIKGLIRDMVEKLEKEANEEAEEKAFCDEEMAKTKSKKEELDATVAKLTSKIDQDSARSGELKDEVKAAQARLAALKKEQAEMDEIRREESAAYAKAKADLELGLGGVRKALDLLRDYYGSASASLIQGEQPAMPKHHEKSGGAASSIIGILEVCESDFAANLAKENTQESDAAAAYEKTTDANKIEAATTEQDVKYKTQEFKGLDKTVSELSSDRDTVHEELDGVNDYYGKLKDRCVAKPESYEERKKRREAEIAGLKEALSVLDSEVAFTQHKSRSGRRAAAFLAPGL